MSDLTRVNLDNFWELLDEILNGILSVLIGLEILLLNLTPKYLLAAVVAIPIVLAARFASLSLPAGRCCIWHVKWTQGDSADLGWFAWRHLHSARPYTFRAQLARRAAGYDLWGGGLLDSYTGHDNATGSEENSCQARFGEQRNHIRFPDPEGHPLRSCSFHANNDAFLPDHNRVAPSQVFACVTAYKRQFVIALFQRGKLNALCSGVLLAGFDIEGAVVSLRFEHIHQGSIGGFAGRWIQSRLR